MCHVQRTQNGHPSWARTQDLSIQSPTLYCILLYQTAFPAGKNSAFDDQCFDGLTLFFGSRETIYQHFNNDNNIIMITIIYILKRKSFATIYFLFFFYIACVQLFLKVYFMSLHNE